MCEKKGSLGLQWCLGRLAPDGEIRRVVLFMILTIDPGYSMRVTLPSAAPSLGPEISRMPSMTRLSRNGDVMRAAVRWRGRIFLDPFGRKKLKANGKQARACIFCVGGLCGCGDHRPGHFEPNSENFHGIRYQQSTGLSTEM